MVCLQKIVVKQCAVTRCDTCQGFLLSNQSKRHLVVVMRGHLPCWDMFALQVLP